MEISDSGHIAAAAWDGGILSIRFHSGDEYVYYDVSYSKYLELLGSPSKGTFFREQIKGQHDYSRK